MPASTPPVCPFLGLAGDPSISQTTATGEHRCYSQTPPGKPDNSRQAAYCLAPGHAACGLYRTPPAAVADMPERRARPRRWRPVLLWALILAAVAFGGVTFGRTLLASPATTPDPGLAGIRATATARATAPAASTPTEPVLSYSYEAGRPTPTRFVTPTPEPGGSIVSVTPAPGSAGWWATGDTRGLHLNDSALNAGASGRATYVAAIGFDLSGLPRGAAVRSAYLRLAGLDASRLNAQAGGAWTVQFLAQDAAGDLARASFDAIAKGQAAATFSPILASSSLREQAVYTLALDAAGCAWLTGQLADGAAVVARIAGPAGAASTVFAWDSGYGSTSLGEAPALILALGPAPDNPPPLPTRPVVASTATPANAMTAVAYAAEATRIALAAGTFTPVPLNAVTPTRVPPYLATARALGYGDDVGPVITYTPTPANQATADAYAAYATAVAVTTGTFTPMPPNAATPIVINPTPRPGNAMTAMAQSVAATVQALQVGTPTLIPFNAIIATTTPAPFVATYTPWPANAATQAALAANATAVAYTTGTFTPAPPFMTPTPTPARTPLPLLFYDVTPRPTPTATPQGSAMPDVLRGLILFRTDRDGQDHIYALDPATGRLAWLTDAWPYAAAAAVAGMAPDGHRSALVKNDASGVPQLFLEDNRYGSDRPLTSGKAWNYDPAWSPVGDRIAYVSQEPGNDEIYLIGPDGQGKQRLTNNTWEWDKHPSWSPDGTQIVFWSNRDTGRRQLWIMNADGSNQRVLLNSPYDEWDPIWVK